MWEDNRRWTFTPDEELLWTYFGQKQGFEVKNILMMDLFYTNMQLLAT